MQSAELSANGPMYYRPQPGMPIAPRIIIAVLILIAATVVAAWQLSRNRPSGSLLTPDGVAQMRDARRTFDRFNPIPVADQAALSDAFVSALIIRDKWLPYTPDPSKSLILAETVTEYIRLQSDRNPRGFAEWMLDRGCSYAFEQPNLPSPFDLWSRDRLKQLIRSRSSMKDPDLLSTDELHDTVFLLELDCPGRASNTPTTIAGGEGIAVMYRRVTPDGLFSDAPFAFEDSPEVSLWRGEATLGGVPIWLPPILHDGVLRRDGELIIANVFLASRSTSGPYIPYTMGMYYDPDRDVWHFGWISVSHFDSVPCGAGVF